MKIKFLSLMALAILCVPSFAAERSDSEDDADNKVLQRSMVAAYQAWNLPKYSTESEEAIIEKYMDSLFEKAKNSPDDILNILQFTHSLIKDDDSSSEDDQPNGLPVHRVVISGPQELPQAAQNLTLPHREPSALGAGASAPTSAAATACVSSRTSRSHKVVSGAPKNAPASAVARIMQLPLSPTYASITRVAPQPPSIQLGIQASPKASRGASRGSQLRGSASRGKTRGGHFMAPRWNRSTHQ